MIIREFKELIKKYDIDIFYFCSINEINISYFDFPDEERVSVMIEKILNNTIKEQEDVNIVYSFFDMCQANGLKINNDKVDINLHNKNISYDLTIKDSCFNKINFF